MRSFIFTMAAMAGVAAGAKCSSHTCPTGTMHIDNAATYNCPSSGCTDAICCKDLLTAAPAPPSTTPAAPAIEHFCLHRTDCMKNGDSNAQCGFDGNTTKCTCSDGYVYPAGFQGSCVLEKDADTAEGSADILVSLNWPQADCSGILFATVQSEVRAVLQSIYGFAFDDVVGRCGSVLVGAVARNVSFAKAAAAPAGAIRSFNAIVASNAAAVPMLSRLGAAQGKVAVNGGECRVPHATQTMFDSNSRCHAVVCATGYIVDTAQVTTACIPQTTTAVRPNTNDNDDDLGTGAIAGIAIGSFFGLVLIIVLVCACTRGESAEEEPQFNNEPTNNEA